MRYTIKLPQDQQDIVVEALKTYQKAIESLCPTDDDTILNKQFDLYGLIGMFKDKEIEIRIEMDYSVHNSFIHRGHNVDFPIYD
tara:strand:- start:229 stop:480 length:252 start_codon:yes stop_codon:yes gene_type:complete